MDEETTPGRHPDGLPRWVVMTLIVLVVVLLLVVVMMLVGGGHRPMRHGSLGIVPMVEGADQ